MDDERIGQPVGLSSLLLHMGRKAADTQLSRGDITKDEYDENAACTWDVAGEDGEDIWEAGDSISISEGPNTNLCDGSNGGCTVDVTITKIGVGNEDNKIIANINAYADAN